MTEQTIAAVFDTAAHADAAIRDLEAAHVPANAISRHAKDGMTAGSVAAPVEKGFWASLFGGTSDDEEMFNRSVQGGSVVVSVKVPEQHVSRVSAILEAHDPVDLDERAASYGTSTTATTATAAAMPAMATAPKAAAMPVAASEDGGVIQVMAESLTVGKRAVSRGGARVRSYVVEVPVEEQVTLHEEKVTIERRPVNDGRAVSAADFTDKVIEMQETREEAVVGKTVRVVEEISLRKEGVDTVETVRDTVRHQEVEVEQIPAEVTGTTATATTTATTAAKVAAAPVATPAVKH